MNIPKNVLDLSGSDWTLICDGGLFPDVPASVPGNVQADLEAARCLAPLWYGMGDARIWEASRCDYTYVKKFIIAPGLEGSRLTLCLDGIDYECEVWLDGVFLTAHKGMYERFEVELPAVAGAAGEHELRVRIKGMPEELEPYFIGSDGAHSGEGTEYWFVNGMNKMRQTIRGFKSITNFSYDWGTNIYTLGITKPAYLHVTGGVRISDVKVQCRPEASQNRLEALQNQPEALQNRPEASQNRPEALQNRPEALQNRPEALQNQPEASQNRPEASGTGDGAVRARLNATWTLDAQSACEALIKAKISLCGKPADTAPMEISKAVSLQKGVGTVSFDGFIEDAALWWPLGHGGQPLYIMESEVFICGHGMPPAASGDGDCQLSSENTPSAASEHIPPAASEHIPSAASEHILPAASDSRTVRFGIYSIEWKQLPGFPEGFINPLSLELNGRKIRTLGSTACSTDLLHGRAHAKGRKLAERAAELGINTLRMHGGQIIFTEDFYDACDELGVMLVIDFPAGNCVVEDEPDILSAWESHCRDTVRALRNHPCVIEWSGGNEMGWQQDTAMPALDASRRVVREEDDRIFRATCPCVGVRHAPWDYNPAIHYKHYNSDIMRDQTSSWPMGRNGEFGAQTAANPTPYKRTIPPLSRFPINFDDPILIRKNVIKAVFFDQGWLAPHLLESLFGPLESLDKLLAASYWASFEGLRYAFDALRRRADLGGCASWSLNEPWPNGAGTFMIDYDLNPTPMAYAVQEALRPIVLGLRYDSILFDIFDGLKAVLTLTSDAPQPAAGLSWSYVLRDHRGGVYCGGEGVASIDPIESKDLCEIEIAPPIELMSGPVLAELRLTSAQGETLGERVYAFGPKGAMGPLRGLLDDKYPDPDFGSPPSYTGMQGAPLKRSIMRCERLSPEAGCVGSDTGCGSSNTDCVGSDTGCGSVDTAIIRVYNDGDMTLLFCQAEGLAEYRPDWSVKGQCRFVPPGESRDIEITANAADGLPIAQTGIKITCLNADAIVIPPEGVPLWFGRRDGTCEGYAGWENAAAANSVNASDDDADTTAASADADAAHSACATDAHNAGVCASDAHSAFSVVRVDCDACGCGEADITKIQYLADGACEFNFSTDAAAAYSARPCRLRLSTSDRSAGGASIEISLNAAKFEARLPAGYGFQKREPWHFAQLHDLYIDFPAGTVLPGTNTLAIFVKEGWFAYDALMLAWE